MNYKIDTILERNAAFEAKDQELEGRLNDIVKRVDKHGYYWSLVWLILGFCTTISSGVLIKVIADLFTKKP